MEVNKSLIPYDAQARVRSVFHQQLETFLEMEFAPRDPHERFQERVLALERASTASPHYLQHDFLENFAKKHTLELIDRREEILENYQEFHKDSEFVEYLKQYHPHLMLFASWESLALALAERHEAAYYDDGSPVTAPPRKRRTAEEVRAKKVRDQQIKIDDKIALAKARLESLVEARQIMDQYDLEDLNLGEIEQELTADILSPEEEDNGNFRQV